MSNNRLKHFQAIRLVGVLSASVKFKRHNVTVSPYFLPFLPSSSRWTFVTFPAILIHSFPSTKSQEFRRNLYINSQKNSTTNLFPPCFILEDDVYQWIMGSLIPRPVRAIRVARGGLEPSAIARGVLGEFSRQAWRVTSHPKSPRTTGNEAGCAQSANSFSWVLLVSSYKYLKTFVPPFLPTRLTAPGSPRMFRDSNEQFNRY